MRKKPVIQKLIAAWLLMVFAMSAAPKAYFHDLLANHKDSPVCRQIHTSAAVHPEGYHCHFDELVVSAPFLLQADAAQPPVLTYTNVVLQFGYTSPAAPFLMHQENRGPPQA